MRKIERVGWVIMIVFMLLGSIFILLALSHFLAGEDITRSAFAWLFATMPAVASAIAAFYTYLATKRAAVATENASNAAKASVVAASFDIRQDVLRSLIDIWSFLNTKTTYLSYNPDSPEKFLITKEELRVLESHRDVIFYKSRIFGQENWQQLHDFYRDLVDELNWQTSADNYSSDGEGWLGYRNDKRDLALKLLGSIKSLCYLP